MRPGSNQQFLDALEAAGIRTALLARFDFSTGPAFLWTGSHPILVKGSGDSLLDNNMFEPLANGVVVQIGDNSFSYTGSEALTVSLAIPSAPSDEIAIASAYPDEWRARPATFWRAIMLQPSDPLAEPAWIFRRVRSGAMDKLEIQADGTMRTLTLTIEGHASLISTATNSTYLDQPRFDPNDTSQKHAVAIANGDVTVYKPTGWAALFPAMQQSQAVIDQIR
ncbi:hypothetical protein N5J77_27770 [Sphingobium yanoikuyae]|jgi:hypothetical protein|uniref:Uncharacterized protein n=1 Tax=Sphingobium yanoikuyae TaxID=13690 RepID=A0AA42X0R5_SPHYA|nr:hypothetical protein [Sphingobium yanoikuyae]MDH2134935.1 hypothetical protein [Sphingobium yanoikuyae]MDH2152788.1 hypothetical protein [Sphingobium yanoikuyae]MDH2170258.1 hypothetical protein [Sphingobium yanoikuyae]